MSAAIGFILPWALPRLVSIPALLLFAGLISFLLFKEIERLQRRWHLRLMAVTGSATVVSFL